MSSMDTLIKVLEAGLEMHGEKPLTNKWLLNILKHTRDSELKRDHLMWLDGPDEK